LLVSIRSSENSNHLVFGHSSADIAHSLSGRTPKRTPGPSDGRGIGTKRSDQKPGGNDLLKHGD
jgi:hypothetical protein